MGHQNSIRAKNQPNNKMKFSPALLFAVAAAEDKKVPPRHPLQRLNRLTEFTEEILNDWFTFLPSKDAWVAKFAANAERMRRDAEDVDRYNREDPSEGVRQLTTGYRKWAERYLSACSGQKKYQHQVNRMAKWNNLLQGHLASQD